MKTFSAEWMNARNMALTKAGEAIIDARCVLGQLEEILAGTVAGKMPDVGCVVDLTFRLQKDHDNVLIGLIESSFVPASPERRSYTEEK